MINITAYDVELQKQKKRNSELEEELQKQQKLNSELKKELMKLQVQINDYSKIENLNPQQMAAKISELQNNIERTIEDLEGKFKQEQEQASITIQKNIPKYEERIKTTEQDIERLLNELKDNGDAESVTQIKKALDLYKNQDTSHGFTNGHLYNSFEHLKKSEDSLSKEIVEALTSYGRLCIHLHCYKKYEEKLEDYNKDIISPIKALMKNIDKSLNDKELIVTLETMEKTIEEMILEGEKQNEGFKKKIEKPFGLGN